MTKGTKNKKIEQTEAKNILNSIKDLDLNKTVNEVSALQVSVQNGLANLSASLTNKIQKIEQIDTAIKLKEDRLKELYDIEDAAITLDDVKAHYEEEVKKSEDAKSLRAKQWVEEELERNKKWVRVEEQWNYDWAAKTKKVKDEFDNEVAQNKRNETVRSELMQKSWTERENNIKLKEQEYADLQKTVAGFDVKLKAEVDKAEKIIGNTMKKDHDHAMQLLKKDMESEKAAQLVRIGAYELTVKGLEEQVKDLKAQLTIARADAKDVASQALQSASGRQVADALQKVVESKDNTTKSK